jgi:hypothetical protein
VLLNKTNGDERKFSPLSSIMRNILNEGGLDHYIARYGGFRI